PVLATITKRPARTLHPEPIAPMPAATTPARKAVLEALASRLPKPSANGTAPSAPSAITEIFGINTFGVRQMRSKLPRDAYEKLVSAIRHGKKLDRDIAPTVAQAIKEWATSRGATHFTHWFLPQTGLTAEKH